MSDAVSVKAVGFAFSSPEVILLSANPHQHFHVYPPKRSGQTVKMSSDGRRNVMLLLSIDKLGALEKWAKKLHRVLVFARLEDLADVGIPALDADTDEDGRAVPMRRQTVEELNGRIEAEAVLVSVKQSVPTVKRRARKARDSVAYEGPTFRELLRGMRKLVTESDEFSFQEDVGIPAIYRLMHDTSQEDFKLACKRMISVGEAPTENVKAFYRWIEGIDGQGPELSKAVDAHAYPEDEEEELSIEEAAERFGVDAKDVAAVAKVYSRLQEIGNEEDE